MAHRCARVVALAVVGGAAVAIVLVARGLLASGRRPPANSGHEPATGQHAAEPAVAGGVDGDTWRLPAGISCPTGFAVKVARSGIYHLEGGRFYDRTAPVRCYARADDAEADGYRRSKA